MFFVVVGVLLLVLKVGEWGPVANWPWWAVLTPFAAAAVWWAWADKSGFTKRRAMEKMENKKEDRRRKNLASLGIDYRGKRREREKSQSFNRSRSFQVSKIESKRAALREKNKEMLLRGSRFDSSSMNTSQMADSEFDAVDKKSKKPKES